MNLALSWQSFVLISLVLNTLGYGIDKYQVSRGGAFQVLIYKYLAATTLMTLAWWLLNLPLPRWWWLIFIVGFVGTVNIGAITAAIRHSLSKTVMTIPLRRVMTLTFSGIILGEFFLFDPKEIQGQLLILALILMLVIFGLFYEKDAAIKRWNRLIWISIFYGAFFPIIFKLFLNYDSPVAVLMCSYWGSLTSAVLITRARSHKLYLGRQFAWVGLTHGTVNSLGVLAWSYALALATVTEVTIFRDPVLVVLSTLVGLIVYGERKQLRGRRLWAMALSAIVLIMLLWLRQ